MNSSHNFFYLDTGNIPQKYSTDIFYKNILPKYLTKIFYIHIGPKEIRNDVSVGSVVIYDKGNIQGECSVHRQCVMCPFR